jgi:hypothetical protein
VPGFAASLGSILDRRSTQVTTFRAQYDAAIKPGERAKQARAQSAPFKQLKTATATRFSVLFEIVQNCVPTLTLLFDRICRLRIGGSCIVTSSSLAMNSTRSPRPRRAYSFWLREGRA